MPKETNQRKGSRSLGPPAANFPALLTKRGRFGKSLCSAKTLFPLLVVLLGLREMAILKTLIFIKSNLCRFLLYLFSFKVRVELYKLGCQVGYVILREFPDRPLFSKLQAAFFRAQVVHQGGQDITAHP